MSARPVAVAVAAAALALAPAAGAQPLGVGIQQDAFGPADLDALPGDVVSWTNVSARTHTVTADDGAFDSGVIEPQGRFELPVVQPGVIAYHCTLHPFMTGAVVVAPVTLDPLPGVAVPAGDPVVVSGRTADPLSPVVVSELDAAGVSRVASTAMAAADGTWHTTVTAQRTASIVAGVPAGASRPRKLLVSDRSVALTVRGRSVGVKVTPPLPYGRVVLEVNRRERFGWWPERRKRLDYVSGATFRVPARLAYRVALLDADRWTRLATSRTVHQGGQTPVVHGGAGHHVGH